MKPVENIEQFTEFLDSCFDGQLHSGTHEQDGCACLFEAYSQWAEIVWTDDPTQLMIYDLRPINDIVMDVATRVRLMVPLLIAYQGSLLWPAARQRAVTNEIVIETVRHLLAISTVVPADVITRCREVATIEEARELAREVLHGAWSAFGVWATPGTTALWAAALAGKLAAGRPARGAKVAEITQRLWLHAAK